MCVQHSINVKIEEPYTNRILEIRQLTGPCGLSKAHIQRIKKIKSGSIFEENADTCGDYGDKLPNLLDVNTWYLDDDNEDSLKEFEESESSSTKDSGFDDLEEKTINQSPSKKVINNQINSQQSLKMNKYLKRSAGKQFRKGNLPM